LNATVPKSARRSAAPFAAVLLGSLALAPACLRKGEVRYYTLPGAAPAADARRAAARYTVHVGPASVPEMLDRPELVLRVSSTELAIDDDHRWAEPLRTGIARAVAESLARQLDGAAVSAAPQSATQPTNDVELTIDVQRLDVSLTEGVSVDVAWTARWATDGAIRSGRSGARAPSTRPGGYDGAVTACALALDAVGSDIARSIRLQHLSRR
jgi:uncharacterized lipoprotein YmbA